MHVSEARCVDIARHFEDRHTAVQGGMADQDVDHEFPGCVYDIGGGNIRLIGRRGWIRIRERPGLQDGITADKTACEQGNGIAVFVRSLGCGVNTKRRWKRTGVAIACDAAVRDFVCTDITWRRAGCAGSAGRL